MTRKKSGGRSMTSRIAEELQREIKQVRKGAERGGRAKGATAYRGRAVSFGKGGGRDSGGTRKTRAEENRGETFDRPRNTSPLAAANPAAQTIAQRAGRITTRHDFPNGGAIGHWADTSCPNCEERIRELEDAERACKAANESQRKTIAELEAERDYWHKEGCGCDESLSTLGQKHYRLRDERSCDCDRDGCGCCKE